MLLFISSPHQYFSISTVGCQLVSPLRLKFCSIFPDSIKILSVSWRKLWKSWNTLAIWEKMLYNIACVNHYISSDQWNPGWKCNTPRKIRKIRKIKEKSMKHRRILSILLAAATAVSVAGCSKNETSGSESSAPDDSSSPAGVQTASNVSANGWESVSYTHLTLPTN